MTEDKTDYTHFKVRVFAHNYFRRTHCLLCGGCIGKEGVDAVLEGYTEDREKSADFGVICRECLDAGRESTAERMRSQAGRLREHAVWLEQLATDVVQAETWASSGDLDRARKELNEEMGWNFTFPNCSQCGKKLTEADLEAWKDYPAVQIDERNRDSEWCIACNERLEKSLIDSGRIPF